MVAQPNPRCTPQEYLKYERAAEFRSEYLDGCIIAMAGASRAHDQICVNITASLHSQLRGKTCEAYTANMRMGVRPANSYFYPDLSVVCGDPVFDDEWQDTVLNPSVAIEVLSPSTEAYDRGDKSAAYRQLESLREYLLVSQDKPRVELYRRGPDDAWTLREWSRLDAAVEMESIHCRILLSGIYERVEFPPPSSLGSLSAAF